ncbi:MAG: flagellum-specific ATP synthase FliI [Deltaproteobacteria bacterium CG11_big_fil_rev_8_21_14_0_20_45_16]|nr:MAG: flagellum-specific ATP synthase FliI [Deltaproteobacteria bacterium CG11_big_fil_rev_8_21_14_0_20_45_16]
MSRLGLLEKYGSVVDEANPLPICGLVTDALGIVIEGYCPHAQIGAICEITTRDGSEKYLAEVVGFRGDKAIFMALGEAKAIGMGSSIRIIRNSATIKVSSALMGRVIDGLGNPLDDLPPIESDQEYLLYSRPINPLKRERITEPLDLGVKAINGLLTVGKGQRMGIMAGSGVGKSVLLGMMARATNADVNVIALVGERGREVREFIEDSLGPEGLERSIVVVATSDVSPLIRMRAAFVATAIAEYFRSLQKDVLLMMDSVTRFAMAQREVGLAAGEPPTTKGYPPSVFTTMPKLFERVGALRSGGSITGLYTVLVEGDDINDPIGDGVRSIVDGHIVLSRRLASMSHFPAIDVPMSTSRVMSQVVSEKQMQLANRLKGILATYGEAEDLINIGAYVKGTNKRIDEAIQLIEPIREFLKQPYTSNVGFEESTRGLTNIFSEGVRTDKK